MTRTVVVLTPRVATVLEATRVAVMSVRESDSTRLPLPSSSSTETVLAKPVPATRSVVPVTTLIEAGNPARTEMFCVAGLRLPELYSKT